MRKRRPDQNLRDLLTSPPVLCALGVTLTAIAVRAPFIGLAIASPDTGDYLARAQLILSGDGLPNAMRTPGLPLLLAGFDSIGTDPVVSVAVLHNVLGMILPAGVLLFGWRFFNAPTGIVAGFLAAASPLWMITEQFALTDHLFGVFLFVAAGLLTEGALRIRLGQPARYWLVAAGVLFGLATLVRGNGQYAIVAIPIAMLLGVRDWRRALRGAGLAVAAMVVVLVPWVLHNIVQYGTPQVTTLGGVALYVRVIDHDRVPPPDGTANGRIARETYNNTYAYAPPEAELNSGLIFSGVLENKGYDNVEVSSIMTGVALEAISQDPWRYVSETWKIFREYQTMYDPSHNPSGDHIAMIRATFLLLGEGITAHGRPEVVPGDSWITLRLWEVGQWASRIVYILSLGGILAIALALFGPLRSRVATSVLLTMAVLGFLVGALSEHFDTRYDMPYASMTWLLMAAASVGVVELTIRGFRWAFGRWPPTFLAGVLYETEEAPDERRKTDER